MRSPLALALALSLAVLGAVAMGADPAGTTQPAEKELQAALQAEFKAPDWLAGTKVPLTDQELTATNQYGLTIWSRMADLQGDPRNFRVCAASLHRALRLNSDPKLQADCILALAIDHEMMFQDYVRGYQLYRQLGGLSGKVPQVHDPQNHLSRSTERMAALGMARNAALLGAKGHARQLLRGRRFEDWRELVDLAVVDCLLGDRAGADAALEQAIAAGGQGDLFVQLSSCGRAVILFYVNGRAELVQKRLPQSLALRERQVRQNGPLEGNRAGQDGLIRTIAANKGKRPAQELKGLVDGVYPAHIRGMHGPVGVVATVKDGRLVDLKVQADEKRAFGAVVEMPRRIIAAGRLPVDAISGATVTSVTIEQAVAEALQKAKKP